MEGLKGKTAVITGGTKGIGYGIAEALLAVGMNVAITGRDREGVDRAVADLSQTAPAILGL
ncbi:MAG: SDR family NAD(P)-dependent oxidoreductase, partial [Cyclobacteriaceae bacterium]|nr:SDR family NAD(P)-dependent oxidoreductase [Cyclobacteriaceae bacterium]